MQYDEKSLESKIKKVRDAIAKWEESLLQRDLDSIRKYSIEIESLGKEILKILWKDVLPGENISAVIERLNNR